jgi:hypothetical protein
MKRRVAKKQIKKVVGYMTVNGLFVVNVVSNNEYTGGTCLDLDEDCYKCEITYTRKRYGAPLCVRARHESVFVDIYDRVHGTHV